MIIIINVGSSSFNIVCMYDTVGGDLTETSLDYYYSTEVVTVTGYRRSES